VFLRHTWLVAILGTVLVGAAIYGAIYVSIAPTDMKIAAGPADGIDVKLVQLLAQRFTADHDKIWLHLVSTGGPKESAEAIATPISPSCPARPAIRWFGRSSPSCGKM